MKFCMRNSELGLYGSMTITNIIIIIVIIIIIIIIIIITH